MLRHSYLFIVLFFLVNSCKENTAQESGQWSEYLGGPDRNHYSSLQQITTENVGQLKVAWEYHSGDSGQVQCNPIVVDSILYAVTASNHVFALDAATGKAIWVNKDSKGGNTSRGVTYWADGADRRILYTEDEWLCALDARNGKPIASFGDHGRVSLKTGLGAGVRDKFVASTTPGTLFEDLIMMPIRVGEGEGAAPGYVQAFNVVTGKLAWVFHTIPLPGEPGYETWPKDAYKDENLGGANNWAGMAIDRERKIVYVPTGSPAFDFYGGNRLGKNEYANSLLALDARTGKLIWHYQTFHHDILDRDLPAPPNLVTVAHDGKRIDAVAQVTKTGYVFLFNRETGEPLFPIEERPFPASAVPGEQAWATQPIPTLPEPFARQEMTEADISPLARNRVELLKTFREANHGLFHPLEAGKNTILFPGCDGGAEWGGAAADPEGILYVNANEVPWLFNLVPTQAEAIDQGLSPGNVLYNNYCIACHGKDRQGNPASGYPSLLTIKANAKREDISSLISHGRGMMPAFSQISATDKQAIIDYLFGEEKSEAPSRKTATDLAGKSPAYKLPYRFGGYNKFLDDRGYPAISPPWGTLTAIDLNTGKQLWRHTLGEFKELTAEGMAPTGTENYGGPVVTAGGVLFIAATKDGLFRAYDRRSGKLLWQTALPAAGFATPSTYEIGGKQYVVIACGGTKLSTKKGDSYVAFALP